MVHRKAKIGDVHGKLRMLQFGPKPGYGEYECECGTRKPIKIGHVRFGATTSCGCGNRKHHVKVGDRFGRLEVVSENLIWEFGRRKVSCRCDCGTIKLIGVPELATGVTNSCGCLVVDVSKALTLKHGLEQHPAYKTWTGIRERCTNPTSKAYPRYGGRGISICPEWAEDCKAFCDWADANGQAHGLEIDRKDNDGNYEPSNCHFITRKANTRNRRSNVKVTAFGETKLLVEWSEDRRCVVSYEAFRERIKKGILPEIALTRPMRAGVPTI